MKINLKKILQKLKPLRGKLAVLTRLDVGNNWTSLSALFLLITVLIFTNSAIKFYKIGADDASLVEKPLEVRSNTLNRGALKDILLEFSQRKENHEALKNSRPVFIDPSL